MCLHWFAAEDRLFWSVLVKHLLPTGPPRYYVYFTCLIFFVQSSRLCSAHAHILLYLSPLVDVVHFIYISVKLAFLRVWSS